MSINSIGSNSRSLGKRQKSASEDSDANKASSQTFWNAIQSASAGGGSDDRGERKDEARPGLRSADGHLTTEVFSTLRSVVMRGALLKHMNGSLLSGMLSEEVLDQLPSEITIIAQEGSPLNDEKIKGIVTAFGLLFVDPETYSQWEAGEPGNLLQTELSKLVG
jgi:hypothetical protein